MTKKQIVDSIESKRRELNVVSERFGVSSDIVLRISQELDEILNCYQSSLFHNE
ncbi:aspartyl-phosphate phosphatase Spo0E family protein [Paenibacillus sp. JDR-2]|uniref:aspartyl-phosphate phosphatase Spo0E family protein n=1 Tax=Paenibacillus sp. (strain JDR-2) TaxID=324057 RepID=UPI0001AAF728|nr:aspartyl-phosphate phosphatase Spo0E family protein [Paenibacillus sp. JDR-2]ACT01904.1 hypothetical protein Pjdr2_3265 [Paenibacillus sp. JDR-2]